jgi:hypothetical protein
LRESPTPGKRLRAVLRTSPIIRSRTQPFIELELSQACLSGKGDSPLHSPPFVGRKPTVHADAQENLYLVFNQGESAAYHGQDPGGRLHIATASAQSEAWSDWRIVWTSEQQFTGEPRVDPVRWANDRVLSVYVQEHPDKPG